MMRYWTVATAILATMAIAMAKEEHTRSLYAPADALSDFEANKHRQVKQTKKNKKIKKMMMKPNSESVSSLASPTAPPSSNSKSKSKGSKCSTSKSPTSKGKGKGKGKGGSKAPTTSKGSKSKSSKSGDACGEPTTAPSSGSPPSAPVAIVDATCELSADLACETVDGLECSLYPSCFATTDTIGTIYLKYTPRLCSDSSNSQGSAASCSGTESSTTDTIDIDCTDALENVVVSQTVANGDTISFAPPYVSGTGGVICVVGSTDIQMITFQTDGTVDLHVGDTFGSLEVIECDTTACEQKVVLSYSATNDSTDAAVELSSFTIKTTGESKWSTLKALTTTSLRSPGKSTKTSEMVKLDLCVDSLSIKANVKGKVEGGTATCKAQQILELS